MKMLIRDDDKQYLNSLVERLENNGIPACIQGTETARMITNKFVFEPSLWVYLNEQFDDAIKVMDDPSFKPSTGIDIEEFYANLPSEEDLNAASFNFLMNAIAIGALAVFAVFIFLHVVGN